MNSKLILSFLIFLAIPTRAELLVPGPARQVSGPVPGPAAGGQYNASTAATGDMFLVIWSGAEARYATMGLTP